MTPNNKKAQRNKPRFWTSFRIAGAALVLILLGLAGISSCTSSDQKEIHSASTSQGTPLPAIARSAKLRTADGGSISLSDYSGQVLLVNLWATWCGPCRVETPELVRLHKEFQARGVVMVGLSTEDPEASAERVKDFVQNFRVDYQIGWAPNEVAIALMQLTGRDAIPQSFIVSRDGRVLKQFVGFNPVTTPPQIKAAIEEALKGA